MSGDIKRSGAWDVADLKNDVDVVSERVRVQEGEFEGNGVGVEERAALKQN